MLMYWKNRAVNGAWKLQRRVYGCSEMKMESELWKSCY